MKIESSIRSKLHTAFEPLYMELENESHRHSLSPDGETHFKLVLVSNKFAQMGRLDRQRLVLSLLEEERQMGLHAFSMKLLSPTEWEAQSGSVKHQTPNCHDGAHFDPKFRK